MLHSVGGRPFFIPSYLTEAYCYVVVPVKARSHFACLLGTFSSVYHAWEKGDYHKA